MSRESETERETEIRVRDTEPKRMEPRVSPSVSDPVLIRPEESWLHMVPIPGLL